MNSQTDISEWIESLQHEPWFLQEKAKELFELLGDIITFESLVHALDIGDSGIREIAILALGYIRNPNAAIPLIRCLDDNTEIVRRRSLEALQKIGYSSGGVETLQQTLSSGDADSQKRVFQILAQFGSLTFEQLHERIGDKDPDIRSTIAKNLGGLKGQKVSDALCQMLHDDNRDVQLEVVKSVRKIKARKAISALCPMLKGYDDTLREEIIKTLGELSDVGDNKVVDSLCDLMADKNQHIRLATVVALRDIGNDSAIEGLYHLLSDYYADIRWTAAKALERIKWSPSCDTECAYYLSARREWGNLLTSVKVLTLEPLLIALKDQNPKVCQMAAEALQQICNTINTIIFGHNSELLEGDFTTLQKGSDSNLSFWKRIFGKDESLRKRAEAKACSVNIANPDVSDLAYAFSNLRVIIIHSETYDFYLLERFVTYAINSIGQGYLKNNVDVYIYGYSQAINLNIYNNLHNIFRGVYEC